MEFIFRFFGGIFSDPVGATFAYIIFGYFILALAVLLLRSDEAWKRRWRSIADMAPGMLTSLGILGTFMGIFLGLLEFDIDRITRSVPDLIEGLKVAFGTSILGLALALFFRVVRPFFPREATEEEDSGQAILRVLWQMIGEIKANRHTNKEGFDALKKSLSGDDDHSIVGQLQRLRTDFGDRIGDLEKTTERGFGEQIKEFKAFSDHMSKAFSEAIINELKSVIHEFNEKISEQFGENFKQLNLAVGRLLEWQENYRQQLDVLQENFQKAVSSIQLTEQSIVKIHESTSAIPDHLQQFNEATKQLHQQLLDLHQGLSSIADMRAKAENAFPEITQKIDEMTTTLNNAVTAQSDSLVKSTEQMKDVLVSTAEQMNKTVGDIGGQINTSLEEQKQSQQKMINDLQSAFQETLSNSTKQLNDSVVQLDEAMQEEIGKVVQTMVENLSGAAERFAKDYKPLLEQVRQIVKIGQDARNNQ